MKKFKTFIVIQFASLRLWYAVNKADKAYQKAIEENKKDKRYYVMPDHNDKLIVMCRAEFRKLRIKKRMSPEAQVKHLLKECFYFTPYANRDQEITEQIKQVKRTMYLKYCLNKKGLL